MPRPVPRPQNTARDVAVAASLAAVSPYYMGGGYAALAVSSFISSTAKNNPSQTNYSPEAVIYPQSENPATDVAVSLAASAVSSRALRAKAKDMGEPPETDYSPQVMGVVEALKAIEIKQTILDDRLKLEKLIIEKKFADLKDPLSARRKYLVTGKAQPTSNEVYTGGMAFAVFDPDYTPSPTEHVLPFVNGVPDFWLRAIQNHENLSEMIKDQDEEALKSLVDIKVIYTGVPRKATTCDAVKPNYKLIFHFLPNPFFHDSVLSKEYLFKSGSQPHSFVFYHAVGTNIRWKSPETDLTHSGASFFDFFTAPPPIEESELYELPEEEYEDMLNALEVDLQAGEDFKDDMIPNALEYLVNPPEWNN